MKETNKPKQKWGKHMQIPEVREKLFELSVALSKPKKSKGKRNGD